MSDKNSDEIVFCLSDLWELFLRYKKNIFVIAISISVISLLFFLSYPSKYNTRATFRELQDGGEEGISIKELFISSTGSKSTSGASSIMLSNTILIPFVQKMGLQANINERKGRISTFFINSHENILSERKRPLRDIDSFEFKDVIYEEEKSLISFLRFISSDSFEVLNQYKKKVGKGRINIPFTFDNIATFTCVKTPKNLKLNKIYNLVISPTINVASFLSNAIKITPQKENRNILCLSIEMRNRHLSAKILNSLMNEYQEYLKKENKYFSLLQLAYLEDRHEELSKKLKSHLDEYISYLTENLGQKGFMTLDQELDSLSSPHSQYLSNIFKIDLELNRLKNVDKKNLCIVDDSFSGKELGKISNDISALKQEKDSINLSMQPNVGEHVKITYKSRVRDIDEKIKKIDLELSKLQNSELFFDNCLSGSSLIGSVSSGI